MPARGFKADKGRSCADVERAARYVRTVIMPELSAGAPFPDLTAFENLHEHSVGFDEREIPLEPAVNPLPAGVEALAMHDTERDKIIVTLSPETYAGLEAHYPRARFCLCHELGHACLHSRELIRLGRLSYHDAALLRGKSPSHPAYLDTEWQANAFAAALLMPAEGLVALEARVGILTPSLVAREFNVSRQAATIRIATFNQHRSALIANN